MPQTAYARGIIKASDPGQASLTLRSPRPSSELLRIGSSEPRGWASPLPVVYKVLEEDELTLGSGGQWAWDPAARRQSWPIGQQGMGRGRPASRSHTCAVTVTSVPRQPRSRGLRDPGWIPGQLRSSHRRFSGAPASPLT